MTITESQIGLVQASAPVLKDKGTDITNHFYKNLLSSNPQLKSIFNLTNQRSGQQPFALASVLLEYALHITNPSVLAGPVENINHKHASLGVTPAQYDVVGAQLLASLEAVLGSDVFNQEMRTAWAEAYGILAHMMIDNEKVRYTGAQREKWLKSDASTEKEDSSYSPYFRTCKVVDKVQEADDVVSLRFWPEGYEGDTLPKYQAGQYIGVRVWVEEEGQWQIRQYTLSDEPESAIKKGYRITPKNIGMVSGIMHRLEKSDKVGLSFPQGLFTFIESPSTRLSADATKAPLVFISAGIGLTPLLSIMLDLLHEDGRDTKRALSWIHSTRSVSLYAFKAQIDELVAQYPQLRSRTFNTGVKKDEKKGVDYDFESRVKLDVLAPSEDLHLDDERTLYYISGPISFMNDVGKALRQSGVPANRMKAEVFGVGDVTF
ncbi:hypothetical protein RGQ29_032220 [Quercus rubra]|uniref:nitric oxide dioxygenase n=1 Tax=Quercus rubra TaxID=3512 RepID=A0AAN7DSW7_QUERU|nr:hypothetical protein RGQ29_032220 [Quercus rubra]